MAQLSIFEKQRHHSDKDFTCSIGKHDRIYITLRHETWKRFTSTDYISVYIGKNGALKFGDPKDTKMLAPCFKLNKNKEGNEETRETTRYLQIEGKKYPAILEQVRRTAGSYDFPEDNGNKGKEMEEKSPKELTADPSKIEAKQALAHLEREIWMNAFREIPKSVVKLAVRSPEEVEADAFAVRRNQFKEDLKTLTAGVQRPEERIAIVNALAALYGRNNKTVPYDPTDPWDIP